MEVLPATTVTVLTTQLTTFITDNALIIVGVIALGVGLAFVLRWFNKGTRRIKA